MYLACRAWSVFPYFPIHRFSEKFLLSTVSMFILHQTNQQCLNKKKNVSHAWCEWWAIQTQRFSLPSSLGPELSRFWGNRTSVSSLVSIAFWPASHFYPVLYYCLVLSVLSHWLLWLQRDCWEALAFSALWLPRMWQNGPFKKTKKTKKGGVILPPAETC